MEPKYLVTELFVRSRDQPTGESIIDAVVQVLRDTNMSRPGQIAKHLGVRKEHLSGAITILTGKSLDAMIVEWRMLQALYLLRTTDKDYPEIAHLCGFSQTKTLARAMERVLHMSPYEYRNGCHREQIRRYRKKLQSGLIST